uniref:Uncharacterized protein n=1 Tax=Tanacetum cinerariifolium TaxID=118510 RepID=A0A699JUL9_TANCI|nr:hypothetical protein [Tanacetum cinerariifolium]
MGEPLSLDRVFDFPKDESEPHPAYDFFAPGPLLGYASNPNNNNWWLEANDYLLGELEAIANKPMVVPAIEEVAEPVAKAGEEQVVVPVVYMEEEQMAAPVMGMEEDLAGLFVTPPPVPAVQPPSVYVVGGPSIVATEGPSFPLPAPKLYVPPAVQVMVSKIVHAAYRWEQVGAQVEQGQKTATQRDETIAELT